MFAEICEMMCKNHIVIHLDYFSDDGITCERYWCSAYSPPQPKGLFRRDKAYVKIYWWLVE